MSINVHRDAKPMDFYKNWRQVGASHDGMRRDLCNPETTCLARAEPLFTYRVTHETTGKSTVTINYGLCRLAWDHDGEHSARVFYCDACDRAFDEDHPHVGNGDVTICEECNRP